MKMKEICEMKSGFQGKISNGDSFKLIKLKDVTRDGAIKYEGLEMFDSEKVNEKYILKKNDIILKAKSGDNTAAIFNGDSKNVVASAHFIIITVKDENIVDPEYLTMYLNSEFAQYYFKKNSEGTTLPIVKLKTLEELNIEIIDIEKQKELASLYKLIKQEKRLMEEMIENREKEFTAYLREMLR